MEVKICTQCDISKPLDDFYTLRNKPTAKCKLCTIVSVAQYRESNYDRLICESKNRYNSNIKRFMVYAAKSRAKRNNLPFNINENDFDLPEYCPILNIPLQIGNKKILSNSPTLDRIIPDIGYVKNNVWVISNKANTMKNNATPEELLKFADWIYKTFKDDNAVK